MRRFEEIALNIKKELEDLKRYENLIVVEGKKDLRALENLDLDRKNIFVLNETGKSLYVKIEEIAEKAKEEKKEVVILTDLDKKGKKLYFLLKKELGKIGIKTNGKLRDLLIRSKISHIEGLATFIENN